MGYTNYFTPKASTPKQFKEFVEVCRQLRDACRISLEDDTFDDDLIFFNGVGGNGHETMVIAQKETEWQFCKTERKPYDLLVCAVLIAAEDMLGFKISSDGDVTPDGWKNNAEGYRSPEHYDPCNWPMATKLYNNLKQLQNES